MNKSDQRIRKFNPGTFQSDKEVIDQFVVRKCELDIVFEALRGNIDSPSCQHVLVVAPRGRGKTMLLARVTAELNTNDELSECLLPVRFMEESHEILDITDFWLETLFHLARESVRHDATLARELQEAHADLTDRWRERELADRARATVLDAADRLGKKLVLMVENLQALCKNVDADFGWQLRGALQSEPQIMLLATATSRFKGLDDATEPFFEQFRIINLKPLTTEECRQLWPVVSGDEVSAREIRPLEILTGGSPRLLVIIAQFAQYRSLRQLMEELVTLIDDHTEYFRSHLEVLASVERRVYLALIDLWQPSNAGEIAARARKDVRTVSTMLGRLVNRGAVIVEGTGRNRRYIAAERLYSIYYKLRRERNEAAVVENLIHFMAVFYSKAELAEIFSKLIAEATESKFIREGLKRAIAEHPQVGSAFSNIVLPSIEASNLATSIDNESVKRLFGEIATMFNEAAFEKVIETVDQAFATWSTNWYRVPEPLIATGLLFKALAYKELGDLAAAVANYDEATKCFGNSDAPAIQVLVAWVLYDKGNLQVKLGDLAAAVASYDEVIVRFGDRHVPDLQKRVAWAFSEKGDTQVKLGDLAAAVVSYDEVIARFGDSDVPHLQKRVAWALFQKGTIKLLLDELTGAISFYDEIIERFGNSGVPEIQIPVAGALSLKGLVQIKMGSAEEALRLSEELERKLGILTKSGRILFECQAMLMRAQALMALKKRRDAMEAFRSAYVAFPPDNEAALLNMQWIVPELIANGTSERVLLEILSSDKEKADALAPLIVALRQRAGEDVRAPVEILEVAKDINKDIEEAMAD